MPRIFDFTYTFFFSFHIPALQLSVALCSTTCIICFIRITILLFSFFTTIDISILRIYFLGTRVVAELSISGLLYSDAVIQTIHNASSGKAGREGWGEYRKWVCLSVENDVLQR